MTIFLRSRLPLIIFLIALFSTNSGCDLGTYAQRAESSSAGYVTPKVVMPEATSSEEEGNPDGPVVAGSWAMDARSTSDLVKRKVNPVFIGGPANHNKLVADIKDGSMVFELKADGSFTCVEVMDSTTANYKGNWKVSGSQVTINQTHMNGSPVKDVLAGTMSGNKMDLEKKVGPVSVPIILKRR